MPINYVKIFIIYNHLEVVELPSTAYNNHQNYL